MNSPAFVNVLILAFQITCILRLALDRYTPGAVDEDSLVPNCIYSITCITLMYCNESRVKLLLLMQWLLYFDYYNACVVILDMTSSTPERFRRSGFGV